MRRSLVAYIFVAILSAALTTLFQPFAALQSQAGQSPESTSSSLLAQSQSQPARSDCQTFRETGKTVCGRFLQYWQQNGGLPQQGFPITDPFSEVSDLDGKPYNVQYFERAVFELHPEQKPPFDVLLSQLGTFRLRDKYKGAVPQPTTGVPGSISGRLGYPSEVVPALDIYALEAAGSRYYTVRTTENQQQFTMGGVIPGVYYVVAYLANDPHRSGGYTQFVLCGLNATCNDHSLIPVTVNPGQAAAGVRVEDWYSIPSTFPRKPGLSPLAYFWPRQLPRGMAVMRDVSGADEGQFTLEVAQPRGGQFSATIVGGQITRAGSPPTFRGTPITVRGVQGMAFTTGAGYSIYWTENGNPYAIVGNLGRDDALALANSLEPLDLGAWRQRLAQVR